jgi:hypothetical protein
MHAVHTSLRIAAVIILMLTSRAHPQPAQATTSVQIVNATSVPVIALKINENVAYEAFAQGLKSADAPIVLQKAVYEAEDKQTGSRTRSEKITFEPGTYQSLVILGDFSRRTPPGMLRQPGEALTAKHNEYAPNVLFQLFSHAATKAPVRLRVINGMPGKSLTFVADSQEIVVKPGDCAILESQPAIAQYGAKVDGENIPLLMRQEGLIRNAMVVFFLKSGKPAFVRAFENNAESNRMRVELERTR